MRKYYKRSLWLMIRPAVLSLALILVLMSFQERKGLYAELYKGDEKVDLSKTYERIGRVNVRIFNQSGKEVECNFKDVEASLARNNSTIATLRLKGNVLDLTEFYVKSESNDRIIIKLLDISRKANGSRIIVSNPVLIYQIKWIR